MNARETIAAHYGLRTLREFDDFLEHAGEAAGAYATREQRDPRIDEFVIEALVLHLGEAAKRCGEQFLIDHEELGLGNVIGARNVVAHGYDITDHELLWKAIRGRASCLRDRHPQSDFQMDAVSPMKRM